MYITRRSFSKLTEVKHAAQAATRLHEQQQQQGVRVRDEQHQLHDLQVTRLPNELVVASRDADAPLSRVCVAVKAGARYEPSELPGIAHVLRNAAALATKHCTSFGLVRNFEQLGASFRATTTRDHTIYNLDCPRENVHDALRFLAFATTQHAFRPWEVKDVSPRIQIDLEIYKRQPHIRLIEHLHKAAYRGGLAHSLYAPEFAYPHINSHLLSEWVKQAFTTSRMSIGATGLAHDTLLTFAQDYVKFDVPFAGGGTPYWEKKLQEDDKEASTISTTPANAESRYVGGEYTEDTVDHLAYTALVWEGVGTNQPQEALALALLRELLGSEPHIKWSDGVSPLQRAAQSATTKPVAIAALNICHADTGLFGFSVVAGAKDVDNVLRAGMEIMQGKGGVDERKLQGAKNRLVSSILMADECSEQVVQELAVQSLNSGGVMSAGDAVGIVERLGMEQVISAAKKATSSRPTLVGVGNLAHFPRLDDLIRR